MLSSCCIGDNLRNIVEIQMEEAIASQSYVDVSLHLPSVISPEDSNLLISELKTSGKYENTFVFCQTFVVSKAFLGTLSDLFKPELTDKASKFVESGQYAAFVKANTQGLDKLDMSELSEMSKKDERRSKAAQGKAGGGAQGRETKTKAANKSKKGARNKKKEAFNDDSDDNDDEKNNSHLQFMSMNELSKKLSTVNALKEAPEELLDEMAGHFLPSLNKNYEEYLSYLHQSKMTASMQSKRKNFQEFQDKIHSLVENLRLFDKGLQAFDTDEDVKDKLDKYLMKTLAQELMNECLVHLCQEHQVANDKLQLNVEQRQKLIAQLPKDVAQAMLNINKALNEGKATDFLHSFEDHISTAADVTLKKIDRKKDRQVVFNHRQNLIQQIESCQDPALTLHLVSLVLFQGQTGCMLHASGKFVPNIIAKVTQNLDEAGKITLTTYQNLVVSLMAAKDSEEKGAIQKQLEEMLRPVKDVALNAKK